MYRGTWAICWILLRFSPIASIFLCIDVTCQPVTRFWCVTQSSISICPDLLYQYLLGQPMHYQMVMDFRLNIWVCFSVWFGLYLTLTCFCMGYTMFIAYWLLLHLPFDFIWSCIIQSQVQLLWHLATPWSKLHILGSHCLDQVWRIGILIIQPTVLSMFCCCWSPLLA